MSQLTSPTRTPFSLSVSTKIFLGFVVVIVAFGSTSAYALIRMSELRRSVTVLWKEIIPVSADLDTLSRQIKSVEGLLDLDSPDDDEWLQRILPTLDPFDGPYGLARVADKLDEIGASGPLTSAERAELARLARDLRGFYDGPALPEAAGTEPLPKLDRLASGASDDFYDALIRRTLQLAASGNLAGDAPEARATVRVLRRLNREVVDAGRRIAAQTRAIDGRVDADERATTLAVILAASGALIVSLLMLWLSQLTLGPIRQLRELARRIAGGAYDVPVQVRSRDEIGQLAAEFNSMAAALAARDEVLARQREELLRAERLAIIGKLAAQITHEVRNPLSSIGLNAELLEEELGDDPGKIEARESLGAIIEEVQRLKSITEEYLHFARLPKPDLGMVDIGEMLSRFLHFLSRELDAAGVTLTTHGLTSSLEGGPPPIRADQDQLRQALLNICRNAIEAVRAVEGPRTLAVSLAPAPNGVTIRIEDNGPGIPEELRARLFEPFVTGKAHGTGLGLALTREIVLEHGGEIVALSPTEGGRGAAFVITLPARGARDPVVDIGPSR